MTRTFIALELDEALQGYLDGIIRQMAPQLPGLRFVDPASIHLTLAFLGALSAEQLAQATNAAVDAARQGAPFAFHLSHLGIFGPPRQPRVLWIGVEEPAGALLRLNALLNQQLAGHGFAVEQRPFAPHLTLARIKARLTPNEFQRLQLLLSGKHAFTPSPSQLVNHLSVMKSELSRSGATYTRLQACPMGR